MVKKCIICGKEFQGKSNSSRYCSDECRNTPLYTDEINGEQYGHLTVTNAFRKKTIKARKMAEEAMFGSFLKWFQDTYPDRWKRMTNTDSSKMK